MKNWLFAPSLAVLLSVSPGCDVAPLSDATLTIVNESSYALYEIRIAPVDEICYGRNLLGNDPLFPSEDIEIILDCGIYDVWVVDQDGVLCELYDLELCFADATWVIDDIELALCEF